MANGQGGLNGIESISGVQPAQTSAIEKITLLNTDYDYTKVNNFGNANQFLQLTAQASTRKPFSSTNLDFQFNDKNYVGGNQLAREETIWDNYLAQGAGGRLRAMG